MFMSMPILLFTSYADLTAFTLDIGVSESSN